MSDPAKPNKDDAAEAAAAFAATAMGGLTSHTAPSSTGLS